jgi:hypothetical protein
MAYTKKVYAVPVMTSFVLFLWFLSNHFTLFEVPAHVLDSSTHDTIPNLVHYVWFIQNAAVLRFDFEHFVSIYSAHLYFQPDTIYIHTDATPKQVAEAIECDDKWTRAIMTLPNIRTNQIAMPLKTKTGRPINKIEHRSDFARTEVLYNLGGTYMDMDVIPLRDIKPLRHSGFANVVGQELNGGVNSGMTMHKPRSVLLSIFKEAQHDVFDDEWTTHSTLLLTDVTNRLVPMPGEVLILQRNAFAPSSWRLEDTQSLLKPHLETAPLSSSEADAGGLWPVPTTAAEARKWWDDRLSTYAWWSDNKTVRREEWEIDYSASYVIHAFHNSKIAEWDNEITLGYVTARQSNYARAVYPAIWHAIDTGVITV